MSLEIQVPDDDVGSSRIVGLRTSYGGSNGARRKNAGENRSQPLIIPNPEIQRPNSRGPRLIGEAIVKARVVYFQLPALFRGHDFIETAVMDSGFVIRVLRLRGASGSRGGLFGG
jgi:hypothetical protein